MSSTDDQVVPGLARATHWASLVIGFVVLIAENRSQWFTGDDWDFILNRGLHHAPTSIWDPHNEHWSTVPILIYRFLMTTVGLGHYLPWVVPVLLAHLAATTFLWRIMLVSEVEPWVATWLAAAFVVVGAGAENLLWAFQLGFVGSLAFGLAALYRALLVRHEARWSAIVLIWTLLVLALMCSTIGVPMIVAVGLAALRDSRRRAVLLCAVPAVAFVTWFLTTGRNAKTPDYSADGTTLPQLPAYVWNGLTSALERWTGVPGTGGVVLLVLAVGAASQWRRHAQGAGALATAATAPILMVMIGYGRLKLGVPESGSPRYSYLILALFLPLAGTLLSQALTRHTARGAVAFVIAFVLAMSGVGELVIEARAEATREQTNRATIVAAYGLVASGQTLLTTSVEPSFNPDVTVGALKTLHRTQNAPTGSVTIAQLLDVQAAEQVAVTGNDPHAGRMRLAGASTGVKTSADRGCTRVTTTAPAEQIALAVGSGTSAVQFVGTVTARVFVAPSAAASPITHGRVITIASGSWLEASAAGRNIVLSLRHGSFALCGLS